MSFYKFTHENSFAVFIKRMESTILDITVKKKKFFEIYSINIFQ